MFFKKVIQSINYDIIIYICFNLRHKNLPIKIKVIIIKRLKLINEYCLNYIVIHIAISFGEFKVLKVPFLQDERFVDRIDEMVRRRSLADHRHDDHKQDDSHKPQQQEAVHEPLVLLELETDDVPFEHVPVRDLAVDLLAAFLLLQP